MKIVFLSIEFSIETFSGNGVYATSQVRGLQRLGHDVLVICGSPIQSTSNPDQSAINTAAASEEENILPVLVAIWGRLDVHCAWQEFADGCAAFPVAAAVADFAADVVVAVDWHGALAYESLARTLHTQGASNIPPCVFNNYRVFLRSLKNNEEEEEFFNKYEGSFGFNSSSLCSIVLSRSDAEFVRHYCLHQKSKNENESVESASSPPPPLHVILPALRADIAALPLLNNTRDRRNYILCCVRASPEKEPHRFVDLICALQQRGVFENLGIIPLICGAGWAVPAAQTTESTAHALTTTTTKTKTVTTEYVATLRQRLAANVPSCQIIESFLGPLEMAEIYSKTLLNVHPCAYDAFGMTIVEAASQEVPSLVAHQGHVGATDLLSPERNEVFVTDMEVAVEELADVVEALLKKDESSRQKLIDMGMRAALVARAWTEDANAAALVAVLDDALRRLRKKDGVSQMEEKNEEEEEMRGGGVAVVAAAALEYSTFEERFLTENVPVILTGAMTDWGAVRDGFVTPEGGVNIDLIEEKFARKGEEKEEEESVKIMVTDTAAKEIWCKEMTLLEYCRWWRRRKHKHSFTLNSSKNEEEIDDGDERMLYLKDWHFAKDFPSYDLYRCLSFFLDDWLNEWYDSHNNNNNSSSSSDYRFVYLGPANTSTPLHTDVLKSHSWSANVVGRKLWCLLPPQYSHLLLDDATGCCHPRDFYFSNEEEEKEAVEKLKRKFPLLTEAQPHILKVIQYPGEVIFIPSGWFHTVRNLDDCLSINHNWISSHSVCASWRFLQTERARAALLIDDCRELNSAAEFEALVQRNVEANAGVGYSGFGAMVRFVVAQRVSGTPPGDDCTDETVFEKIKLVDSKSSSSAAALQDEKIAVQLPALDVAALRLKKAAEVLEELIIEQLSSVDATSIEEIENDVATSKEPALVAILNEIKMNAQCLHLILSVI